MESRSSNTGRACTTVEWLLDVISIPMRCSRALKGYSIRLSLNDNERFSHMLFDDTARNANCRYSRWDVGDHDGSRSDDRPVAHISALDHDGASAEFHTLANFRSPRNVASRVNAAK